MKQNIYDNSTFFNKYRNRTAFGMTYKEFLKREKRTYNLEGIDNQLIKEFENCSSYDPEFFSKSKKIREDETNSERFKKAFDFVAANQRRNLKLEKIFNGADLSNNPIKRLNVLQSFIFFFTFRNI